MAMSRQLGLLGSDGRDQLRLTDPDDSLEQAVGGLYEKKDRVGRCEVLDILDLHLGQAKDDIGIEAVDHVEGQVAAQIGGMRIVALQLKRWEMRYEVIDPKRRKEAHQERDADERRAAARGLARQAHSGVNDVSRDRDQKARQKYLG
jgi:hypothetical protein